jgi:hypothetical protein
VANFYRSRNEPGDSGMSFAFLSAVWIMGFTLVLITNLRLYKIWNVPLYLAGGVVFASAGLLSASLHHGAIADEFFIAALIGMILMGLGAVGIPPRTPQRRARVVPQSRQR